MGCHESALDYLRSLGYNVVLLPKSDIAPLQLLSPAGRGTFDRFGQLDTVLVGDGSVGLPTVQTDLPAANIAGRSSSGLKLGIGLSVLGNIVAAMGGSPLGLEAAYQKAATVSFEFREVYEDRVQVAALDRYVAAADLDPYSRSAGQLLSASDLLVVTSTLKTATIAVRASDRGDATLALDAPEIQGIVGAGVTVSRSDSDTTMLSYSGPTALVFGFQAVRLHYDDGFYRAIEPAGGIRMRAPAADAPWVVAPGPLVRLIDA